MKHKLCNLRTWETEVGGSRAPGQPELYSKTLLNKQTNKQKEKKHE
jgi:hypothetical protein